MPFGVHCGGCGLGFFSATYALPLIGTYSGEPRPERGRDIGRSQPSSGDRERSSQPLRTATET